jgi:GGDEF domain-containing protein
MFSRIRKIFTKYKELEYLAYHDSLTGLLNRNWLYKNINSIDKNYVFFIDINNLKKYNEHGHTYGDWYIKTMVFEIKQFIKDEDILIRYAGDEFILFSNYDNTVNSCKLYSVGMAKIGKDDIKYYISQADTEMIKAKKEYKSKMNQKWKSNG